MWLKLASLISLSVGGGRGTNANAKPLSMLQPPAAVLHLFTLMNRAAAPASGTRLHSYLC